ncbi:hypothetical protein CEXT_660681 [Caerostris extrusa]|uniref:Uncharacterized protein n=1 Tax=Caerostris extrusa TaxID=172846 RepID=A0AAV4MF82_CAEEX|nr:hypothetical protein CEXT_660681 [Caerostris extrusa]
MQKTLKSASVYRTHKPNPKSIFPCLGRVIVFLHVFALHSAISSDRLQWILFHVGGSHTGCKKKRQQGNDKWSKSRYCRSECHRVESYEQVDSERPFPFIFPQSSSTVAQHRSPGDAFVKQLSKKSGKKIFAHFW